MADSRCRRAARRGITCRSLNNVGHARNTPRGLDDFARGLLTDGDSAQEDLARNVHVDVNLTLDRIDLERSPTFRRCAPGLAAGLAVAGPAGAAPALAAAGSSLPFESRATTMGDN